MTENSNNPIEFELKINFLEKTIDLSNFPIDFSFVSSVTGSLKFANSSCKIPMHWINLVNKQVNLFEYLSEPVNLHFVNTYHVKLVLVVARQEKQTVYTIKFVPEYTIQKPFDERDYLFKCYGGWNYWRFCEGMNGLLYTSHLKDVEFMEISAKKKQAPNCALPSNLLN